MLDDSKPIRTDGSKECIPVVALALITLFFLALGVAGLAGWTFDSRDVEFGLRAAAPAPLAHRVPELRVEGRSGELPGSLTAAAARPAA